MRQKSNPWWNQFAFAMALLMALTSFRTQAGTAFSPFTVRVRLIQPGEFLSNSVVTTSSCISQTLSTEANAQVRVLCNSDQVVQIEANSQAERLGVHGGAFRYFQLLVAPGVSPLSEASYPSGWRSPAVSAALVSTALSGSAAYGIASSDAVEILVTF